MKKLMTLMLGMSLLSGTAALVAQTPAPDDSKTKTKKKSKKKKTDDTTKKSS